MSTIMLPRGSATGRPAPIAAAIGSSTRYTARAPAASVASWTASRSTFVIPLGTQRTTCASGSRPPPPLRMKCRSICSVVSKSAITPCRSGRIARIEAGVRPIMRLASAPTACTSPVRSSTATTEGSKTTIPSPRTKTSEFAVPRSTASSRPANERRNGTETPWDPSAKRSGTTGLDDGLHERDCPCEQEHDADAAQKLALVEATGQAGAEERARNRSRCSNRERGPVDSAREMPDHAGGAHEDADEQIRADGPDRLLADESEQRGHPQGAEDEADDPAEETDHGAADDGGPDVELIAALNRSARPEQVDPERE